MKRPPVPIGVLPATAYVIASNAPIQARESAEVLKMLYGDLIQICDGVDDHIEIQAAIDALPATGGEVKLLDGTYHVEVQIDLDSNQTLRGCGKNTILTTATADLVFLSAVGGSGTELTGIVIANLQIDGGAGDVSDCGIYFDYVDYSLIQNVYSRRHTSGTGIYTSGIYLLNSDFNQIVNNTCQGNVNGIYLNICSNTTIFGNTCQGNSYMAISLDTSNNNTISGNTCVDSFYGIYLKTSAYNSISGNTCKGSGDTGIDLDSSNHNTITGNTCVGSVGSGIGGTGDYNIIIGNICARNGTYAIALVNSNNNTISGNTCVRNSQTNDNNMDNIYLSGSSYNLIMGNLCRAPTVGTTLTVGELAGATDIHVTVITGFVVGDGVVIDLGGGSVEYHRISAITAGIITIPAPGLTNAQIAGETIDVPEARYGINISNDACNRNCLIGNDLYDSGKTGDLNDVPFTNPTLKHDNRNLVGTGWLGEV